MYIDRGVYVHYAKALITARISNFTIKIPMRFTPKLNLTKLSKSSDSFVLNDFTGNYPTSPEGYGVPGGPVSAASVSDLIIKTKEFNTDESTVDPVYILGSLGAGLTVYQALRDGVFVVKVLFGVTSSAPEIWSNVGKILSVVDGIAGNPILLNRIPENIDYVGTLIGLFAVKTVNVDGTLELYEDPGLITGILTRYYTATVRFIILNEGDRQLLRDISNMSLDPCGCSQGSSAELVNRLLLKLSAQTAFACGDFQKANKAATLFSDYYTPENICTTC